MKLFPLTFILWISQAYIFTPLKIIDNSYCKKPKKIKITNNTQTNTCEYINQQYKINTWPVFK